MSSMSLYLSMEDFIKLTEGASKRVSFWLYEAVKYKQESGAFPAGLNAEQLEVAEYYYSALDAETPAEIDFSDLPEDIRIEQRRDVLEKYLSVTIRMGKGHSFSAIPFFVKKGDIVEILKKKILWHWKNWKKRFGEV